MDHNAGEMNSSGNGKLLEVSVTVVMFVFCLVNVAHAVKNLLCLFFRLICSSLIVLL